MSIFEAIGMSYVIVSTIFFSAQLIYFGVKGAGYLNRLIHRAQTEEALDLQRAISVRRELANAD